MGRKQMKQRIFRMMLVLMLVGFGTLAFAQSHEQSQDKPAGEEWVNKTIQTCASCHGKKGVAQTQNFPILAGQYQDYLLHALKAYRDGDRDNGIMSGQVQGMTDAQFKALAAYYSRQESPLHTPTMD